MDYDNCATLFVLAGQCSANQLASYCAYYGRKYQIKLISVVCSENANTMYELAVKARLKELQSACSLYLNEDFSKKETVS